MHFFFIQCLLQQKKTLENNLQTPLDVKILAIPIQRTFESNLKKMVDKQYYLDHSICNFNSQFTFKSIP